MTELIKHAQKHVDLPQEYAANQCHFTYIMNGSKIVSWGYNKTKKTHPMAKKYGHLFECIHSELDALIHARHDLTKCKVVNVRIKKDGSPGLSKPCPQCQEMLKDHGIEYVYYTTDDGFEVIELC